MVLDVFQFASWDFYWMAKNVNHNIKVITIDGPSGSGKSTAARMLAERIGFSYLDTGAMYRAVTFTALRSGMNLRDSTALIELTKNIDLALLPDKRGVKVFVDGRDVSDQLRTAEVSANAHFVASRRGVRDKMVRRQRSLACKLGPLVAEGRDQGTVVFPDAQIKFFLDATPDQRARRRYLQMQRSGEDVSFQQVLDSMLKRDSRDRSRTASPLEVPEGAIVIDTTDMSVERMVDELAQHVRRTSRPDPGKTPAPAAQDRHLPHDLWYAGWRQMCRVLGSAAFGIRSFDRHNVPAAGGAVLASNHQSFLDPMVVGLGLPRQVHYMARDSLFRNFAFGRLISSLNAFPVKRNTADLGAIKESLRRLKNGKLVLLFGEGTRTHDGRIAPLQSGIVMLARKARVPVIPVVIDGAFEAWPRHNIFWQFQSIRVVYGEPMPYQKIKDLGDAAAAQLLWQSQLRMQHWLRTRYDRKPYLYDSGNQP